MTQGRARKSVRPPQEGSGGVAQQQLPPGPRTFKEREMSAQSAQRRGTIPFERRCANGPR